MTTGLKPYPAYKDSGVPWLGEVPGHWDVLPNRALFTEVNEREHPEEQMLSVTISKGVIRQRALLTDSSKKDSSNQDKSAYKLVRPGDIAYNKMRAWQGAVGVSDYQGIVSPAYVVQHPRKDVDSRYLHHLLRTPAFAKEAERWSYGITSDMWSLRPEHFKMIYACLPPFPEQAAIVRFLDHADRRIRRYIRARQKLIKLLEEQKQAIIHRAVTRGLDPNVRLKPSGVEWLGDVPEHWEVKKLRSQFRSHGSGTTPSGDGYYDGGIPWVMTGDLTDGWLETTKRTVTQAAMEEISALRLYPPRSLIVAMYGATIGKSGILKMPACVNQACCVLAEVADSSDVAYLQAVVNLARSHLIEQSYGGGQPNINAEIVRALRVPLPPLEEQQRIADTIANISDEVAIDRAQREIALLREYRTRLIADVVTGKIDVREAAVRLPDETDEAEPLDEADAPTDGDEDAADDVDAVPEEAEA